MDGAKAEARLAPITNAEKDALWALGHKLITIRDKVMRAPPGSLESPNNPTNTYTWALGVSP